MGLETGIWASRLGFRGGRRRRRRRGLETGILASRLGFEGGTEEEKENEEEEEEKIPHLCESIGHPPLRGRFPKTAI